MRIVLLALVGAWVLACHQPVKQVPLTYLNANALYNKDSVGTFLATVPATQADSGKALFLHGIDLLKNGRQPTAAIAALKQSLRVYPAANSYYELGNAFLETKSWPKALQAFAMAEEMDFHPLGSVLFKQASCYAEMDSTEKMYDHLKYAVQAGFVDRSKVLNNPHFSRYKQDSYLLTVYNEAMSGNGDPDEIRWQGYLQDFKRATFPYRIDSGSLRRMGEPQVISYDYEHYVPEMRDHKFSRDVGSEYFYVARILQTELNSVVLYGCRSYEAAGAPVYYILASFDAKGRLLDKMVVGGAKTYDDNYREFTAQGANRFQIDEYKNTYEKSTDENGFENNRIVSRQKVGTLQYAINQQGRFVTTQAG